MTIMKVTIEVILQNSTNLLLYNFNNIPNHNNIKPPSMVTYEQW